MARKTRAQLEEELTNTEKMWLAADAAACQAHECVLAAKELFANGHEARASILVDAAGTCLAKYTERS